MSIVQVIDRWIPLTRERPDWVRASIEPLPPGTLLTVPAVYYRQLPVPWTPPVIALLSEGHCPHALADEDGERRCGERMEQPGQGWLRCPRCTWWWRFDTAETYTVDDVLGDGPLPLSA